MFLYGRECTDQHQLMVSILLAAGGVDAELLKPKAWTGKIADVYYPRDDWIFEVKSLVVDRPADPQVQSAIGQGLMRDAARFGGPIAFGTVRIEVSKLPEKTARNLLRTIGSNVQRAVRDGNNQIKATREALARPDAKGCLALISPPHELSPSVVGWLVSDALRSNRNTSINSVVIAQTPLLAPFGQFADGSSYVIFPGVNGAYLPMAMKRKIGRKWSAAHGQRYQESTPERIDEMVQQVARGGKSR